MEHLTLSNENGDYAQLHNYDCMYGKVCFVLIHLTFKLYKLLAEIGDWE